MTASRFATVLIWTLALAPVALALALMPDAPWESAPGALTTAARLTGVGGLSFMLVAAILSCRVPGFDLLFGGLTKLWRIHHQLATVSFLLLLLHPLLFGLAASGGSAGSAIDVLFGSARLEVWLGWGALLAMMVFLAPSYSFFGQPRYQRWKSLHRLAGLAVVLGLAHAMPLASAIPRPWGSVVWLFLAALAVAAVAYRFWFSRVGLPGVGGTFTYRVGAVENIASNVVELRLRAKDRKLAYRTGQFIYLTPFDKSLESGYREEHPYTLSSSPTESDLRIAVKGLGDASHALQTVEPGSAVRVEGPYGALFERSRAVEPEVWIAGGIGISPFLSRARYMRETESIADVVLIYCVQDEARAIFSDELAEIAHGLDGFKVKMHYFYREGPLNAQFLKAQCADVERRAAYACGPAPLLALVRKCLHDLGVPLRKIRTEEFELL